MAVAIEQIARQRPPNFVPLTSVPLTLYSARRPLLESLPSEDRFSHATVSPILRDALIGQFGEDIDVVGRQLATGAHNHKGAWALRVMIHGRQVNLIGKVGDFSTVSNEADAYDHMQGTEYAQRGLYVDVLAASSSPIITPEGDNLGYMIMAQHGEHPRTFRDLKRVGTRLTISDARKHQRNLVRITATAWQEAPVRRNPPLESVYSMQREEFGALNHQMDAMLTRFFGQTEHTPSRIRRQPMIFAAGAESVPLASIQTMLEYRRQAFRRSFYTVEGMDLDLADKNDVFDERGAPRKIDLEMTHRDKGIDPAEAMHVRNKHIMAATGQIDIRQMHIGVSDLGEIYIRDMHVSFSEVAHALEQQSWNELIPQIGRMFNDPQFALKVLNYRLGSHLHAAAYASTQEAASIELVLAAHTFQEIQRLSGGKRRRAQEVVVNPGYLFAIPGVDVAQDTSSVAA